MNDLLAVLLAACAPHHALAAPASERVAVETLPVRALTFDEAKIELWRSDLRPAWRAPTAEETAAVEFLVPELLRAAASRTLDPAAVARATAARLRIERWEIAGRQHLVLLEAADQRRGAGAYLFSLASPPRAAAPWVLWQAPHAYYDLNTGRIAAQLYFDPPPGAAPSAFFTNTLHRYTQADGRRGRAAVNPADACHNPEHLLNVATLAAARAWAGATVVQLHGFAADDDGDAVPADVLAVISAGSADAPSPLSTAAAAALRAAFGPKVRLFPTEIGALGATTNVEMRGLREIPGARFLHVETADPLRDLLLADADRRAAFGSALFTVATQP